LLGVAGKRRSQYAYDSKTDSKICKCRSWKRVARNTHDTAGLTWFQLCPRLILEGDPQFRRIE
jgi:hypothetical protein